MLDANLGLTISNAVDSRGSSYVVALNVSDTTYAPSFRRGRFWEEWMQNSFDSACAAVNCADGVVLDLGANLGTHTLYLARHHASELWAFEPQRSLFLQLVLQLELNHLRHVWPMNVALTARPSLLAMGPLKPTNPGWRAVKSYAPGGAHNGSSAALREARRQQRPLREQNVERLEPVLGLDLDSLWAAQAEPRVPLIKIDVEGHEVDALIVGGRRLLESE